MRDGVAAVLACAVAAVVSMALTATLLTWLDARELDETDGLVPGLAGHAAAHLH